MYIHDTCVRTRARTRVRTHDVEDALIKLGYVFKKTTARNSRRQCNSCLQEDMMTGQYSWESNNIHCHPTLTAEWWSKLLLFSASLPRQWASKCRWRQVLTKELKDFKCSTVNWESWSIDWSSPCPLMSPNFTHRNAFIQQSYMCGPCRPVRLRKHQHARPGFDEGWDHES